MNPSALESIFPPERLTWREQDLAWWGRDSTTAWTPAPSAVVFPEEIAEIQALVRLARETGLKLVPSGGRTGLAGGAMACSGEVVVSFDRMNRVLDLDRSARLAHCQAGLVTGALQSLATEHDLFYPVNFASAGSSQIGGNIATNAGGLRVIRHGGTRRWVAGLTLVTGTGDLLRCNRGLVKNATGYDFRHLFIGSEGTLGFVVEAEMRLTEPPPEQQAMLIGCAGFPDLLSVLQAFQSQLRLSAFEFFCRASLDHVLAARNLPDPLADVWPFYALLEFDEAALSAATAAFERCQSAGWRPDAAISQSRAQSARLWALREGITESLAPCTPFKHDLSVRIEKMSAFVVAANRLLDEQGDGITPCWFGHMGDGNLHLNLLKPPDWSAEAFQEKCRALCLPLFRKLAQLGGSISGEHGIGLLKRDFLEFSRQAPEIDAMRRVKRVFDPDGIMNPGKLF